MQRSSLFKRMLAAENPFSTRDVIKDQPDEVLQEISDVIIRRNYDILFPAAAVILLITVIFVISDLNTKLWIVEYPVSMMNLSAEIIHGAGSVMFILSHLDKKVINGDLKRKQMYSSLLLALFTVGDSCYCIGDTIRGRDPGSHYFELMVLCILPILSNSEFFIYYIVIYMLPSLITSLLLGNFDVLYIGIYISAILLHKLIRANFVKGELHRIKYEQANRELENMSVTDPLTRVGNRQRLYKYLSNNTDEWIKNGETVCLVMIDIDKFKNYNDTYSHLKGDECLVSVASAISGVLRDDTSAESLFIRFGGEEFMFILAGKNAEAALLGIYPKIREKITELNLRPGNGVETDHVTVSLGAYTFRYSSSTVFEEELKKADNQLYIVKENGRDGLCYKDKIYRTEPAVTFV